MVNNYTGVFEMYDVDTLEFNPPNENIIYDWPIEAVEDGINKVNTWTTWARAFSYWLKEKFDFIIEKGPGTSMGKVGYEFQVTSGDFINDKNIPEAQMDNDWNNTKTHGLYPINNTYWEDFRTPSIFRPEIIEEKKYYTNDGTTWTGKWKENNEPISENAFDDYDDRFDLLLYNNNFNNLGLRFKYPISTNGIRFQGSTQYSNDYAYSHCSTYVFLKPGYSPILNRELVVFHNTSYNADRKNWSYFNYINFMEMNRQYLPYLWESYNPSGTTANSLRIDGTWGTNGATNSGTSSNLANSDHGLLIINALKNKGNYILEPLVWAPENRKYYKNSTEGIFTEKDYQYNKIFYIKSYDNSVIYLAVINNSNMKLLEFLIYKYEDETSGLLTTDEYYTRNTSQYWIKTNGVLNRHSYEDNDTHRYGNIGGMVVSSNQNIVPENYIVSPEKYYRDIRESQNNNYLVDNSGLWRLEKFYPIRYENGVPCKNLYLVTRAGTSNLIGPSGKQIISRINGKRTKFIVFAFNSTVLGENNTNDTSTLFAIPIEREED